MTQASAVLSTLKQLKPELTDKYGVHSISLFGSVLREDFSPERSDINIIVEFSRPVGIEFIDLADYLESIMQRKVGLISKKGLKPKYFKAIEHEILYA